MSIVELFCDVDDFCMAFEPKWQAKLLDMGKKGRGPKRQMITSEIMSIVIHFHQSGYRNFKRYYIDHVQRHMHREFPKLVSYNRFVEYMPSVLAPLLCYMQSRLSHSTGINFVDAASLPVCDNKRILRHRVFAGLAQRGKTSMGWFFGFKLHLVINDCGEIIDFRLTPGNVDDRKAVPKMAHKLWGKLFGDKGYIAQWLTELLAELDIQLITPIRKNMQPLPVPLLDRLLARKRALIETVNDQLKNISQVSHTRHRSPFNFLVNLLGGLIAYSWQPRKPSLNLWHHDFALPALI